jgi:hypothetical protein
MKIMINEHRILFLERVGETRSQQCPYASFIRDCGDWCPHFGEPQEPNEYCREQSILLTCGDGRNLVGTIEDRRRKTP